MTVALNLDLVSNYTDAVRTDYESWLKRLVDIPSVSMDPAHKEDIKRAAEVAKQLLEQFGAEAEIVPTDGYPVVIGHFRSDREHPTVTIYNHLDVQPAEPSEWSSPPFNMSINDGLYRGRGSTDDKGPALAALFAARYAKQEKIPLNIKFIWELEEEIGSPSFHKFLQSSKAKLETDSILVSDTIWVSKDRPAVPYGLRGLQGAVITLETGRKDVHSGLTGGLARNPIGELGQLLSECYDARTGAVHIPGFYDDVAVPSPDEVENFVKSGFTVKEFMQAHELLSVRTNEDRNGAERIWAKPTFEVHGLVGGYSGPGVKTVVPHKAELKVTMRLVPNQEPEKIFLLLEKFVKDRCPDAKVHKEGSLKPFLGEYSGPYARSATAALKAAFGKEPAFIREGGSIGAVVSMQQVLAAPIVLLGLSLPEHGYHAINENFDWQQASGGIKMFVHYFNQLAQLPR